MGSAHLNQDFGIFYREKLILHSGKLQAFASLTAIRVRGLTKTTRLFSFHEEMLEYRGGIVSSTWYPTSPLLMPELKDIG
jgi:hypothetical protein